MSDNSIRSLHTLPVELVYRILDNLDNVNIFWSLQSVCTRIDTILDTYHPYQVNFIFLISSIFKTHYRWEK